MIAFQMGAKATRDALFLSSFPVSALPAMVMAAAVVSVVLAFAATRVITSVGPTRVIPTAFAASAVLLVIEWLLVPAFRKPVAVAAYFHFSGLGAVLISGFWSIVNERFDPRTAKKHIGRIAAGGTIGGLFGGLLAERAAVWLSVTAMFPILALLHLVCALLVLGVRHDAPLRHAARGEGAGPSGLKILGRTRYLRAVVAVVLLTTVAEGLIDYVFKARAAAVIGDGESLLRLFAAFYTGTALLTVIVQAAGSRFSLERLGLGRTVGLLPMTAAVGSLGALVAPRFGSILAARGAEAIVRNGLYRAGYELLFAPLAPQQKRATKALVDVGVVRFGDIVGGAIVQVTLIAAAVGVVANLLLGLAVAFSLAAMVVAVGLQRGYVKALERSLLSRAGQLDLDEARDAAARTAMMQSAGGFDLTMLDAGDSSLESLRTAARSEQVARPAPDPHVTDPELAAIGDLQSRQPAAVRKALATRPFPTPRVAFAVPLLAWDDMARDAMDALRDAAPRTTGQLVDRLLDPTEDFAVRRRVPLVLAACPTQRAIDGLLDGLSDARFEVRYRCGRALTRIMAQNADVTVDQRHVQNAVLREVAVDRGVWESRRLLDRMEDEAWSPVLDEVLRERADRSLEHVFTMLALFLPKQPLKIAFRGLHTSDQHLRGTALEYLESALPDDIRKALWPFLEDTRARTADRRSADTVLNDLLQSNASIAINLEAVRKRRASEPD